MVNSSNSTYSNQPQLHIRNIHFVPHEHILHEKTVKHSGSQLQCRFGAAIAKVRQSLNLTLTLTYTIAELRYVGPTPQCKFQTTSHGNASIAKAMRSASQ